MRINRIIRSTFIISMITMSLSSAIADQLVKLKDVAQIEGARSNQLVGTGLVVGLDGTGDSQQATVQEIANTLQKLGVNVSLNKLKTKNIAAVIVTADLPPFIRPGAKIDVTVSSIGDAKTLQGGLLIQTPLQAADGNVYAVAQGSVSVGGFVAGGGGSSVSKNHTTVARIPSGAIVEQAVPTVLNDGGFVNVLLNNPDFTTAVRAAKAINAKLGSNSATALDAATIQVKAGDSENVTALIAEISDINFSQAMNAKIIVNERTGTVVIGGSVQISPVAIAHGSLTVEITTDTQVSQPNAGSKTGTTTTVPQTNVQATEEPSHLVNFKPGTTIEDLVRALNDLKVTPRDIIAVLQSLKEAGALHAELEIM